MPFPPFCSADLRQDQQYDGDNDQWHAGGRVVKVERQPDQQRDVVADDEQAGDPVEFASPEAVGRARVGIGHVGFPTQGGVGSALSRPGVTGHVRRPEITVPAWLA